MKDIRVIWEHDFRQQLRKKSPKFDTDLASFVRDRQPRFYSTHKYAVVNSSRLLKAVTDEEFFGFLEVDIHVPNELYADFAEMSPIFCNVGVKFDDIGDFMKKYILDRELSTKPRNMLVGGMKAKQMLISTPLLRWYIKKGLVVTKIYQCVEYTPRKCFANFVAEVSDARRGGDVDPNQAIIADTMKLIGNSGYGSLIMDKEKHQDVKYIQSKGKAKLKFNDPRFRKATVIKENLYEIEMAKDKIVMDLPIQLGYHILQLAKLRMLEFKYDFLDKYCSTKNFEYIEMDTDSAYMALAGKSLEDIIKPSMMSRHLSAIKNRCDDQPFTVRDGFFPRTCCSMHKAYDKRTPGLFKVEAEGKAMIALCSKTYILKQEGDKVKFSSKGVNKNALIAPFETYEEVLRSGTSYNATNQGFRSRDGTIYTYEQKRSGISYFYCKRIVLSDGVHTKPLNITLSPWEDTIFDVVDATHPWSLTAKRTITIDDKSFTCLADVCVTSSTLENPEEYVKKAIQQLEDYSPKGVLLFALTGELKKKNFTFWIRDTFWTTSLSPRASPLRKNLPGQNVLGRLLFESKIAPLMDHDYI